MRKFLVTRESTCVQPIRELIEKQKHRTLVLWVIDCADRILTIFEEKYPQDKRPREALDIAKAWAFGRIKMPIARKAALESHKAATSVVEKDPAACAAARAMGHVVGTVHVETHAMDFVMYAITALVYANKPEDTNDLIIKECKWLYDRLLYWEANIDKDYTSWATFLLKDDIPNKEALLRQKKNKN